ncbi:MAG: SIS domain-containing protein [Clostridia bacterium]|nr:SIS domain-containing protein [Clostridia bacterium]
MMCVYREYLDTIEKLLENVEKNQHDALETGAEMLCDTLLSDGMIYLFGCGHSHIMAEEGFYRAGGLGAVYPVLQSDLMLHEGAVKSSSLERRSELAAEIIARYPMHENDTLIVFSNSGVNGLPVEMARLAREMGVKTIGVCSSAYWKDASRHPQGLRLYEAAQHVIDTGAPHGDATYTLAGSQAAMGPASTIVSCYILNCLLARAAEMAIARGGDPAIYVSGNIAGGREKNEAVIARYRHRVRAM